MEMDDKGDKRGKSCKNPLAFAEVSRLHPTPRRGGRVVEGARLERV